MHACVAALQHIFYSGKNHPGHDGHRITGEMVITLMMRVMRDMSDPEPSWEEVTQAAATPLSVPMVRKRETSSVVPR